MSSLRNYKKISEPHRRALEKLKMELGFFLNDVGSVDIYQIQTRIKNYESAVRKSENMSIQVDELDDIAGMRIIVGTKNEKPVVERFFTRQELGNDLKILKRYKITKPDGYRALHIVVEMSGHYQRSAYPGRVEIQIHTIFEHAFNFLSRSWSYKKSLSSSNDWKDEFVNLSYDLEKLEDTAARLQKTVIASNTDLNEGNLTPHSLKMLINQELEEDISIEDSVDSCRMYSDLGYITNGQLRRFFQNKEISALYNFLWENKNNERIVKLLGIKKSGFWQMFGTRISHAGIREFIESLLRKK